MKEEKGKWEDKIRSKIYDFEADTNPDDWDIISGKISSGGKTVTLSPYRRYGYAAAAAVAAVLIVGGVFFYRGDDRMSDNLAVVDKPVEMNEEITVEKPVEKSEIIVEKGTEIVEKSVDNAVKTVEIPLNKEKSIDSATKKNISENETDKAGESSVQIRPLLKGEDINIELPDIDIKTVEKDILYGFDDIKPEVVTIEKPLLADASQEVKHRRWGFGMGGGSYAMSSTSGALGVGPYSMPVNNFDEYIQNSEEVTLRSFNQPIFQDSENGFNVRSSDFQRGKVKHKIPISAGLGVSYYLNDRWALQSGVNYSLLRSEGSDYNDGNIEWKQNLHFVGVPLSLSYKIAELNRFQFYATAGGLFEYNVAGRLKESLFEGDLKVRTRKNLHMKEPLWSVNTRAGVVYPLWRFINVYAEAGASYYFDNNTKIETIRSDKPFNVSLQAGISLGF